MAEGDIKLEPLNISQNILDKFDCNVQASIKSELDNPEEESDNNFDDPYINKDDEYSEDHNSEEEKRGKKLSLRLKRKGRRGYVVQQI